MRIDENPLLIAFAMAISWTLLAHPAAGEDDDEMPLGAVAAIIETTDNDIELQIFVDGSELWKKLTIEDPDERRIFDLRPRSRLRRQGMSELFFASNPSHYPVDEEGEVVEEGIAPVVEAFLRRFPEGSYEAEVDLIGGGELEGEAVLTHVLPALPEIVAPLGFGDEPAVVPASGFVIDWEPVTTRFIGDGPVQIAEYQVILDEVDPERAFPWIDGSTRRALVNLPGDVTELTVPPEFLVPGNAYEFEVLAIEVSGNATISVGEFVVE